MEYQTPADDRPLFVDWEAAVSIDGTALDTQWWLPALVDGYGGRTVTAVVDSKGEMTIFRGTDRTGTAPAPYAPAAPIGEDFWPLMPFTARFRAMLRGLADRPVEPATMSHLVRESGWMAARVDDELGLAQSRVFLEPSERLWQLAYACTQLGLYPPLGLFEGAPEEFTQGVAALGERPARRVKRALIERLSRDRKASRDLSDRIEHGWRM